MGSIEYQLGRRDEALQLLLSLAALPEDEPDLATIIDKAGASLIKEQDYERARDLVRGCASRRGLRADDVNHTGVECAGLPGDLVVP